jgi:elongation factor P--(R)-beta-lysine ligase
MQEVAELLTLVVSRHKIFEPVEWYSYAGLFGKHLGIDPLIATSNQLMDIAAQHQLPAPAAEIMQRDDWLDLILGCLLQPKLGKNRISFLYDYPSSQASLARLSDKDPRVAQRFEVFINGIELGNGFGELTQAQEQRLRFEQERQQRISEGKQSPPLDDYFLQALAHGLPDCSGVAIGIDRLVMVALGLERLEQVLSFPLERS